jgi:hypothetical protein
MMRRSWVACGGVLGLVALAWAAPYTAPNISGRKINDADFAGHTSALERVDALLRSDIGQPANYVLAGPASGATAAPAWRPLVLRDLPDDSVLGRCLLSGGSGGDPAWTTCPGGAGTVAVERADAAIVGTAGVVDFSSEFTVTESPTGEANVGIGTALTRTVDWNTSAEIAANVPDKTGTGALVFGTAPTLTNPAIAGTANVSALLDLATYAGRLTVVGGGSLPAACVLGEVFRLTGTAGQQVYICESTSPVTWRLQGDGVGTAAPATGALVTAAATGSAAAQFSSCTSSGVEVLCPPDATVGGSITMSEPSGIGTDTVAWKVKNTGVSATRVHEFTDAGYVPSAVVEGGTGGAGKQACFNGSTNLLEASGTACGAGGGGAPAAALAPLGNCTSALTGAPYYDTDGPGAFCWCKGSTAQWCRADTGDCGTVTDCVPASLAGPDWRAVTYAWMLDESPSGTRTSTGLGALALGELGGTVDSTATRLQGAAAASFVSVAQLTTTTAALTSGLSAPFSVRCWARPDDINDDNDDFRQPIGNGTWNTGFKIEYGEGADRWTARVWSSANAQTECTMSAVTTADLTWGAIGLVVNAANTTVRGVLNGGAASCTSTPGTAVYAAGTPFRIGDGGGGSQWSGITDECVVIPGVEVTDAEFCTMDRCGIDGALCECDAANSGGDYYKACNPANGNADCQTRVNTGQLCDAVSNTCRGRTAISGGPTLACTPTACTAPAPS